MIGVRDTQGYSTFSPVQTDTLSKYLIDAYEEIIEPILKKLQIDLVYQKSVIPKDCGDNKVMSLVTGSLKQEQSSRTD